MRDEAIELVDKFRFLQPTNMDGSDQLSRQYRAKHCAIIHLDLTEKELAKHGVIRKEYYSDFRNEIQKL